jgi:hypothetical protein
VRLVHEQVKNAVELEVILKVLVADDIEENLLPNFAREIRKCGSDILESVLKSLISIDMYAKEVG